MQRRLLSAFNAIVVNYLWQINILKADVSVVMRAAGWHLSILLAFSPLGLWFSPSPGLWFTVCHSRLSHQSNPAHLVSTFSLTSSHAPLIWSTVLTCGDLFCSLFTALCCVCCLMLILSCCLFLVWGCISTFLAPVACYPCLSFC